MTTATDVLEVIDRFNDAFNEHNVDGVMALMTEGLRVRVDRATGWKTLRRTRRFSYVKS